MDCRIDQFGSLTPESLNKGVMSEPVESTQCRNRALDRHFTKKPIRVQLTTEIRYLNLGWSVEREVYLINVSIDT